MFSYSRTYFWFIQIVGVLIGAGSAIGGLVISDVLHGRKANEIDMPMAALYFALLFIAQFVSVGVLDAVYSRPRFKLVPLQK